MTFLDFHAECFLKAASSIWLMCLVSWEDMEE